MQTWDINLLRSITTLDAGGCALNLQAKEMPEQYRHAVHDHIRNAARRTPIPRPKMRRIAIALLAVAVSAILVAGNQGGFA